jgi:hypothetical protein
MEIELNIASKTLTGSGFGTWGVCLDFFFMHSDKLRLLKIQ